MNIHSATAKPPVSQLKAIGLAIAAFSLWVLADTSIKLAGQYTLPAYEVVAFLGMSIAGFLTLHGLWRGEVRALWPKRLKSQLLRSCLDLGNCLFVVVALRHLPLTLFYLIVFAAPLVVAILAVFFLKESLGWRRLGAILGGFLGVWVSADPFSSARRGDWTGYAACAVCVTCFAGSIVYSRVLTRTDRPESMTFFSGLVMAVVGSLLMLWHAEPLTARLVAVLVAMGLFCALGNICFFIALKHTTTANVSQYHYTQLISGALLAYLVFGEKPTVPMLLGSTLIVGSGVYVALSAPRERFRH